MSRVPVEELRAEVERSGMSHVEIARALGWRKRRLQGRGAGRGEWDGQRVRQTLGQDYGRGYGRRARRFVNAQAAARLRAVLAAAR